MLNPFTSRISTVSLFIPLQATACVAKAIMFSVCPIVLISIRQARSQPSDNVVVSLTFCTFFQGLKIELPMAV